MLRRPPAQAAAAARPRTAEATQRPTDEELGYIATDDSFTKIIADAARDLSGLYTEARETPIGTDRRGPRRRRARPDQAPAAGRRALISDAIAAPVVAYEATTIVLTVAVISSAISTTTM